MKFSNVLRTGIIVAAGVSAFAQASRPGGGGASIPRGGTPSIPGNNTPPPSSLPNGYPTTTNPTAPSFERPIYLSGKVTLEDGTPPPESIVMQLACTGTPHSVGYTDSKGRFSIDLTNRNSMSTFQDASDDGFGGGRFGGSPGANSRTSSLGSGRSLSGPSLMGCELLASLPGFRSDRVNLGNHRALDNPEVGTIILHRLGNVEGLTISLTSALAPNDAKKAYSKGLSELKKSKNENAEREFSKAVEIYPKYATAWYQLGRLQQASNDAEGARHSYRQALAADPKFISPYEQLALMAARENKWDEVAKQTDQLLRLDPVDFPEAWYYNAAANLNLRKIDAAEKSAEQAQALDKEHRLLRLSYLLGLVKVEKHDYAAASQFFKDYLKASPGASNAAQVQKEISELDAALARATPEKTPGPDEKP